MIRQKIRTRVLDGFPTAHDWSGISSSKILVPVDSSQGSYNALAYALNLARSWNAGIHLIYIININDIPDSESPFMIASMVDRLDAKASVCLESLTEIIEETGIAVVSAECEIGHVGQLLRRKIDVVAPDLVVAGQTMLHRKTLPSLATQIPCPVLLIPEATPSELPKSVVLSCDEAFDHGYEAMVSFIKRKFLKSDADSVLNEERNNHNYASGTKAYEPIYFYALKKAETAQSIEECLRAHKSDLFCLVLKDHSFFSRLFYRHAPISLVQSLSVPVLITKTSQSF
jgi:nucleotide-binding universal stress UspA family protein